MSNYNDPKSKSFSSMFGSKASSTTTSTTSSSTVSSAATSGQQGQKGAFFNQFVNENNSKASSPFVKSDKKPLSLVRSQTQNQEKNLNQSGRPLSKSNVNIPFDLSKLTLEEKLAILEKINAEIENEMKAEKRTLQSTVWLANPISTSAQFSTPNKTSAAQLFRSTVNTQPKTNTGGSLFANKTNNNANGAALANNIQASRPSLARRATGNDTSQFDIKIMNEEFVILRDFLYEQCGIFIGENRKYLMENRLNTRLRELGLHNFSEYYNYLKYDKNNTTELNELFINMTTNETSFFRNNVQLDIFRDKVLAKLIAEQRAKGDKRIHIWSAGCSSGEEPYTIAIILLDLLKGEINDWKIKITANDLSPAMLAIARRGVYSEYALRTTPPEIIEKYFIKEGKQYKIIPAAQRLVQFGQINLARPEQLAKVEKSHIVFCRNVIIYFDDAMKKHVINAFYDNLLPGGFLLIGHSESLHNISRAFKPEHHPGAIIYCKQK